MSLVSIFWIVRSKTMVRRLERVDRLTVERCGHRRSAADGRAERYSGLWVSNVRSWPTLCSRATGSGSGAAALIV
ncbi:MAG: hypothetical protein QOG56_55 [Solirubrobacteraceae bacterium]|nr:hypothetical protein [Solirubrobacteraceae bacterium]